MENIKTVFLDVDNTILDFQKAQHNALTDGLMQLEIELSDGICDRFDKLNKEYWKKFERGEITREKLVIERFERFFEVENISADAVIMERLYRESLGDQHDLVPGAKEGLIYLSSKYPIHLVTNGLKKTQYNRIRLSGIDKYVDKIFISEEVGFRKPEREFFDYALSHAHCDADTTVIIGDSNGGDIVGGKNAGLHTIWYNPFYKVGSADIIMHDWSEISLYL